MIVEGMHPGRPAARVRAVRFAALLLVVLSSGLAAGYAIGPAPPAAEPEPGVLWPQPLPIEPFVLTDDAGGRFSRDDLLGAWTLLFFGYTHCPDVCPSTLVALADVRNRLARASAATPRVVLVSVDPARDRAAALDRYVSFFGAGLRGVTGSEVELRTLARLVGVHFEHGPTGPDGGYAVEHTANVLVVDPAARLVAALPMPHRPAPLAARIGELMRRVEADPPRASIRGG